MRPMSENDRAGLGEVIASLAAAGAIFLSVKLMDKIMKKRAPKRVAQKASSK